jgi:hypothetical protein
VRLAFWLLSQAYHRGKMHGVSLGLILLSGAISIWASAVAFQLPLSSSGRVVRGPGFGTETAQVSFCRVFGRERRPASP